VPDVHMTCALVAGPAFLPRKVVCAMLVLCPRKALHYRIFGVGAKIFLFTVRVIVKNKFA